MEPTASGGGSCTALTGTSSDRNMCQTSTAPTSGAGTRGALVTLPSVSVIVPAFDEERCIAKTLDRRAAAGQIVKAQGACQCCGRETFAELGGYDEALFMGEDVDCFWRLRAAARTRGLRTCGIRDLQVATSARRFDTWPLWRTLVLTNPVVALAFRRRRFPWAGWYDKPPR